MQLEVKGGKKQQLFFLPAPVPFAKMLQMLINLVGLFALRLCVLTTCLLVYNIPRPPISATFSWQCTDDINCMPMYSNTSVFCLQPREVCTAAFFYK